MKNLIENYTAFLEQRTEREVINAVRENVDATNIETVNQLEEGKTYYKADREKNLAVLTWNGPEAIRAIASHTDSPCLHLKPKPIQEEKGIGILKTHYYGGIRKYQWLNIPLTLRGVVYTKKGKRVDITAEDNFIVNIPDLLPHLAKEQRKKEMKEAVKGEQLNPILTVDDVDDAADYIVQTLHKMFEIEREDLVGADLSLTPAIPPHEVGLKKDLIAAYGHDDRSSVYTSMKAFNDSDSRFTTVAVFYDKEEIGSDGTTGAKNLFWNTLYEDILDKTTGGRTSSLWKNTKVLSADVTSGYNPNFGDVQDTTNVNKLGQGVAVEKFGGSGGKYRTQDAGAEFTSQVVNLLRHESIAWQTGENGKIHIGGGGTIAKFIARHGADVIDIGVPVLGMHAPLETVAKSDIESAYQAFKAFYEKDLQSL